MGGVVPRCEHVDLHQSLVMRWAQATTEFTAYTWETIVESVSWVTEDSLWEHEWITETNATLKENLTLEALDWDIDVPCPLQWALLWFSAPTNLNRKFVNNGTPVAKTWDTVSSAIEFTCSIAFDGAHTPRHAFYGRCQFSCATHKTKTGKLKKKCRMECR